jgi:hypothetical protein
MTCAAKRPGAARSEQADHGAHGAADDDDRPRRERLDDLQSIVGVALQAAVPRGIVCRQIRHPAADEVVEDDAVALLVRRREPAPHALVAAEAVREDHRQGTVARHADVVSLRHAHAAPDSDTRRDRYSTLPTARTAFVISAASAFQ